MSGSASARTRVAACPQCGKPSQLESSNPWRPFCTERCKMIDLGAWFEDRYAIPAEDQSPDSDQ